MSGNDHLGKGQRGSGLIVALGVLAMLAVMATTFITLMRVNARLTTVYTEDLRAQLLTAGVVNYCMGILRDDLDRTLGKYENRDAPVGGQHWYAKQMSIPGRNTDWWARKKYRYATGPSNDIWYVSGSDGYEQTGLYNPEAGHRELLQASFLGENMEWIYVNEKSKRNGPGRLYLASVSPNLNGYDDDLDGVKDPPYNSWPPNPEFSALSVYYYDSGRFLTHGRSPYLLSGERLTGYCVLQDGLYWRWAAKMGVPEEAYMNLNAAGNLDLDVDPGRLSNMDGRGLGAYCANEQSGPGHLGPIAWKGYSGEYISKYPRFFNLVQYSPYQADPYRLLSAKFHNPGASGATDTRPDGAQVPSGRASKMVPEWVRSRWGKDGRPADGSDHWRVGWRRDGATYYKIPSPDNPQGDDDYFGAVEALNHQSEDIAPGTSRILKAVWEASHNMNLTRSDFGRMRSLMSSFGCDTVLRGKIWPGEGPPYTATGGDWKHVNILKRVNVNIVGASGPEGLPNEDGELKTRWLVDKKPEEQRRLYYMLEAMLKWSGTSQPEKKACQFVASLTDLVDRDHDETYFACPRGGTAWALGVEKFPVINEVAVMIRNANKANFELYRLRFELYNPAENIPWIPDEDEAYEIGHYFIKIKDHAYRLRDLKQYGHKNVSSPIGDVGKIGADGMYADPNDATPNKQSWSRCVHVGWESDWPVGVTKDETEAGLKFQLWKPLKGTAATHVPLSAGKVEAIEGERCVLVDNTFSLKLIKPHGVNKGPGGSQTVYVGVYRRFDPLNAKKYQCPNSETDAVEQRSIVHCPGWSLTNYPTLGKPNIGYPKNATKQPRSRWSGNSFSPYGYKRRFERNFKIVDGDLPSIGWLAEVVMHNAAEDGPITWVHGKSQPPMKPYQWEKYIYSSDLEKVKVDLFKPFGDFRNLHLFDMFTVWDPSNDGIDNDGDGAIDDDDTGNQADDKLGPEVRVYGVYDINHIGDRHSAAITPGHLKGTTRQGHAPNRERGVATVEHENWVASGPRDSIGDLLRIDALNRFPGYYMGGFYRWGDYNYRPYVGGSAKGTTWGMGRHHFDKTSQSYLSDDDEDGIIDERDERDFYVTQLANYLTTRSHAMTIEIIGQVTDRPYYPGDKYPRKTYRVRTTYGQRHLVLLVDRSTTLRINEDGTCDFTGPIRILARRWSHVRN